VATGQQTFTNVPFVMANNAPTDATVAGTFPPGTVFNFQWTGVHVDTPCGPVGYANVTSTNGGDAFPERTYSLSQQSGTWSFTTTAGCTLAGMSFYTWGHFCSGGHVDQVIVAWETPNVAYCAYGTELKSAGTFVYYLVPSLIDTWLATVGMPWLDVIFTPLYFTTFNAQNLCAAGPPQIDTIDLSTLDATAATVLKILEWVAWPNLCQCKPGTPVPTPYPPPTAIEPVGWPTPPTFTCADTDICATLIDHSKALAAIQQTLGGVAELVTLLQRYRAPFAYIRGATHAGLSGSHTFDITRLLGFDITVQAVPDTQRDLYGNPPYLWNLGWLSVSDGGGMLQELRPTRAQQIWLPQQCQEATHLGYALTPGVVIDITELEAEP
jgi:hypothetical protein